MSIFLVVSPLYAVTTVSLVKSVAVTASVPDKFVSPITPPPVQNPSSNNGVPLTLDTGTDSAVFKGRAYPGSSIVVIKNGLVLHELAAFSDGTFEIPVRNILPGTYTFSLQAKDGNGLKSSLVTYTIVITGNVVTEVSGILIPPTITTNKTEVRLGDDIVFSGKSIPSTTLPLSLFAKSGITKEVMVTASGTWTYTLSTKGLDLGDYTVKGRTKVDTEYTLYSDPIVFTVGTKNTMRKTGSSLINARCDLNSDGRVNLLDFSIMAFWYKRLGFPMKVDLNSDGRVNLTDLSILAYCWTG